jgi:hypothetical protein
LQRLFGNRFWKLVECSLGIRNGLLQGTDVLTANANLQGLLVGLQKFAALLHKLFHENSCAWIRDVQMVPNPWLAVVNVCAIMQQHLDSVNGTGLAGLHESRPATVGGAIHKQWLLRDHALHCLPVTPLACIKHCVLILQCHHCR